VERVAFLIEETNRRIGCLLNPESLVVRRTAGVRPRRGVTGHLTGAGLADDPLLYTGGGRTELTLDLLFDVSLAGSSITAEDVRDLTQPLWNLAENTVEQAGRRRPPRVRFIWGKAWNIPGVVVAVAEHLEHFTAEGIPRRSWLRMRFVRIDVIDIDEATTRPGSEGLSGGILPDSLEDGAALAQLTEAVETLNVSEDRLSTHQIIGGGETGAATGERLDQLAEEHYGDPTLWRLLAAFNDIADPLHLLPGLLLQIPPIEVLSRALSHREGGEP
jgi:hypothetical protein